ncbi:alpha/beta hydrolase, partial [Mycobacterium sp. ITM-2017-0098]
MLRAGRLIAALVLGMTTLSPSASAAPITADEPYSVAPVWSSCSQFFAGVSPIPTAQCGTVAVPIDYAKPEGAQAQLAVLKVPASGSR